MLSNLNKSYMASSRTTLYNISLSHEPIYNSNTSTNVSRER